MLLSNYSQIHVVLQFSVLRLDPVSEYLSIYSYKASIYCATHLQICNCYILFQFLPASIILTVLLTIIFNVFKTKQLINIVKIIDICPIFCFNILFSIYIFNCYPKEPCAMGRTFF